MCSDKYLVGSSPNPGKYDITGHEWSHAVWKTRSDLLISGARHQTGR
jgi:hypothetical protein